jgi:hypothetical protein
VAGSYFYFLFKLWLCVSLLSFGYFVDVESECNWYLRDIIYSLIKKNEANQPTRRLLE